MLKSATWNTVLTNWFNERVVTNKAWKLGVLLILRSAVYSAQASRERLHLGREEFGCVAWGLAVLLLLSKGRGQSRMSVHETYVAACTPGCLGTPPQA